MTSDRPLAISAIVFANRYPGRRLLLSVGSAQLVVELATTPEETAKGLSGRTSLSDGEGMLFVMRSTDCHPFWMRGTSVPLTIAFLSEEGTIREIRDDMEPHSETFVSPTRPTRLALEVPRQWFQRKGVAIGDRVSVGS